MSFLSIPCLIRVLFLAATPSMTTSTARLPFLSAAGAAPLVLAPAGGAAWPRGCAGCPAAGFRICVCGIVAAGGLGPSFFSTGSGLRMIVAWRERSGSFFGAGSAFTGAFSAAGGAAAAGGSSAFGSSGFSGFSTFSSFSSFSGFATFSSFSTFSTGSASASGGAAASSGSAASSGRRTALLRMTVDLTRFSTTSLSPLAANSRRTRSTSLSSRVLEWDLTAMPRVFSFAMNSLFSIPNSLASSYTLVLDILETPECFGSARACAYP